MADKDGDKLKDDEDKCPEEAGVARWSGCPVKDSDADGLDDDNDECIHEPGTVATKGCPGKKAVEAAAINVVQKAATNTYFETASAKLKTTSNAALNGVVRVLKENMDLNIIIEGHTDNTGKPITNQQLSTNRANAVKKYLVAKGINTDRIEAFGFGGTRPVTTNKTAAGRAKNRRVVLTLK